jgi:hypothetical protein
MSPKHFLSDSEVVAQLISILERANPESKERLFQTLGTYLGESHSRVSEPRAAQSWARQNPAIVAKFTEDRSLSPKEFILQKQPKTDVEKVACLAYYLSHFQSTPHFKTVDISRLNTDAAQTKFSNPADAVNNAMKLQYLTQAGKGMKQITALGEQFVEALPDREAAKAAMSKARKRKRKTRKT